IIHIKSGPFLKATQDKIMDFWSFLQWGTQRTEIALYTEESLPTGGITAHSFWDERSSQLNVELWGQYSVTPKNRQKRVGREIIIAEYAREESSIGYKYEEKNMNKYPIVEQLTDPSSANIILSSVHLVS
ncbi:hypothetical protein ACJX0J_027832, partial [Zea mays]